MDLFIVQADASHTVCGEETVMAMCPVVCNYLMVKFLLLSIVRISRLHCILS